jgi:probable rRNA maturation factor
VAVRFHNDDTTYQLTRKIIHKHWIVACIESLGSRTGSISFIFTSNAKILQMNREYLKHNYFTDVITFDYTDGNKLSGDIFISIDQVRENAYTYGAEMPEELRRVMIHGVLHLAGYGDSNTEEKSSMRKMENDALNLWSEMVGKNEGI